MNTHSSRELRRYNYLAGEIEAAYHEMSLKLGLSDSAMMILYAICDRGDSCLLRDICRQFGISKQTVNSALRKLEAEGVIYLESADAKNKRICLTEKGKRLADQTARQIIETENDIFSSWEEADVENYLKLTERFLHDFKARSEKI